ncbi:MAG: nitronate monooxygenase [Verrucomicrobiota bacterium]
MSIPLPIIIQGGMGVAVSNWRLARAVSQAGQLGVVSGTLISVVLSRRLQAGDPDGAMRRALENFPLPDVAARVLAAHYIPGGKPAHAAFAMSPMPVAPLTAGQEELEMLASFTEVFLAKEGHDGLVGINLLEKIQFSTLPALYGALLAGVDYVLMGAGVPRAIPGALDALAEGRDASLKLDLADDQRPENEPPVLHFSPRDHFAEPPRLSRPSFIAIVSSSSLAVTLARKSTGRVDGFVVGAPTAGGHNAPPRGPARLNAAGEPIYGPRDEPGLERIRELGLPFWLAGNAAGPTQLAEAFNAGATGVQIGTAFAFCEESGLTDEIKQQVRALSRAGLARVHTDPLASPTGFPFKVVQIAGTLASRAVYRERPRVCDLGYLRQSWRRPDGTLGYRCPAGVPAQYAHQGGATADTEDRKCLCNGLLAAVGLPQTRRHGYVEPPLVTAGEDVADIARFIPAGAETYHAADVLAHVLGAADDATPAG